MRNVETTRNAADRQARRTGAWLVLPALLALAALSTPAQACGRNLTLSAPEEYLKWLQYSRQWNGLPGSPAVVTPEQPGQSSADLGCDCDAFFHDGPGVVGTNSETYRPTEPPWFAPAR